MQSESVNIQIPESLMPFFREKAGSESGARATVYLESLVLRDLREAEAEAWLERMHREAIESGDPIEMTPQQIGEMMLARIAQVEAERGRQAG